MVEGWGSQLAPLSLSPVTPPLADASSGIVMSVHSTSLPF